MSKAVLLMAHGAPRDLDDVEAYVMRIRHGRPLAPELMADIKQRYARIGGSPLLKWTMLQAEKLQAKYQGKIYIGMRHSEPYIAQTVRRMDADGVDSFVAVCLAPQFSSLTIGAYREALDKAIAEGRSMSYDMVRSYARHPALVEAYRVKLAEAQRECPGAFVIFTAHSLPRRVIQESDPYDWEAKETARMVALAAGVKDWRFAYQSQGLTSEPWLGPTVESVLDDCVARGVTDVILTPIGFVCDHVEILYDIDVFFHEYAEKKGIKLTRSASLNDSLEFTDLLLSLITGPEGAGL